MCRMMCNIGVYSTHVLHVQNICITYVSATHVIHLYLYTYNTPKIGYICNTPVFSDIKHHTCITSGHVQFML